MNNITIKPGDMVEYQGTLYYENKTPLIEYGNLYTVISVDKDNDLIEVKAEKGKAVRDYSKFFEVVKGNKYAKMTTKNLVKKAKCLSTPDFEQRRIIEELGRRAGM